MSQVFYGTAYSREQALIMDGRMLHFSSDGDFIDEMKYTSKYVQRSIQEVDVVSVLAGRAVDKGELGLNCGGVFTVLSYTGRLPQIIMKINALPGVVATLRRQDDFFQGFILFKMGTITPTLIRDTLIHV